MHDYFDEIGVYYGIYYHLAKILIWASFWLLNKVSFASEFSEAINDIISCLFCLSAYFFTLYRSDFVRIVFNFCEGIADGLTFFT